MQLNLFDTQDSSDIREQIKRLRRQIVVHSIIYYRFSDNIWTDGQYDRAARKLKELQAKYPNDSKAVTDLYEDFKTWQDDTCPSGYDLKATTDVNMIRKAQQVLDYHYGKEKDNQKRTGTTQ